MSTGQGTTIVYAEVGANTITCHGNTTVYADHSDTTNNCTKVIYVNGGNSANGIAKARAKALAKAEALAKARAKARAKR